MDKNSTPLPMDEDQNMNVTPYGQLGDLIQITIALAWPESVDFSFLSEQFPFIGFLDARSLSSCPLEIAEHANKMDKNFVFCRIGMQKKWQNGVMPSYAYCPTSSDMLVNVPQSGYVNNGEHELLSVHPIPTFNHWASYNVDKVIDNCRPIDFIYDVIKDQRLRCMRGFEGPGIEYLSARFRGFPPSLRVSTKQLTDSGFARNIRNVANMTLGVAILIAGVERHGKFSCGMSNLVLIRERPGKQWNLIGGKVEDGESISHALEREVQEETGLDYSTLVNLSSRHSNYYLSADRNMGCIYRMLCIEKSLVVELCSNLRAKGLCIEAFSMTSPFRSHDIAPWVFRVLDNAIGYFDELHA